MADKREIGLECTFPAAGFEGVAGSTGVQVHLIRFERSTINNVLASGAGLMMLAPIYLVFANAEKQARHLAPERNHCRYHYRTDGV